MRLRRNSGRAPRTSSGDARRLARISFDNSTPWGTLALFVFLVVAGVGLMVGYLAYRPVPYVRRDCKQLTGWSGFGLAPHRSVWWCSRDGRMLGDGIRCDAVEGGGFVCALPFRQGLAKRKHYGDDVWVSAARSVGYCPDYSAEYVGEVVDCLPVGGGRVVSISGLIPLVIGVGVGGRLLVQMVQRVARGASGVARRGRDAPRAA